MVYGVRLRLAWFRKAEKLGSVSSNILLTRFLIQYTDSDMAGVAQWLERLVVVQKAVGSNPITRPRIMKSIRPLYFIVSRLSPACRHL